MMKLKQTKPILIKVIVLNIINIILVIGFFMIIKNLPAKATDVQERRGEQLVSENKNDVSIQQAEIAKYGVKIKGLEKLFLSEETLLQFISEIDLLKNKGVVDDFQFLSSGPVPDKTGNQGIPIIIEFKGNISQINDSLRDIEGLDSLLRPIDVELEVLADNNYKLHYGAFLYLNEEIEI